VDPYYLAQKAQEYGYHPEIILAGRRLNDSMGDYVASEVVKLMISKDIPIKNASILVLGITFKENCPDVRNTKAVDVITALKGYGVHVTIYDPWANKEEVKKEYQLESIQEKPSGSFDAVVLTVAHKEFLDLDFDSITNKKHLIYDVKNILPASMKDGGL
jgi:UDP-N-acetyl-D-galactosamine dehydrogenase